MDWPWRRFEAFFQRHLLRRAKDQLERQRDLMITAVNANSNYDGEENAGHKRERIDAIYQACEEGVAYLYSGEDEDESPFSMENDPLFAPVVRMAERGRAGAQPPLLEQAGMGRVLLDHDPAIG